MITVQAPQLARSQTRFGPVTSSRLRSTSSRVRTGFDRARPLLAIDLERDFDGSREDLRLALGGLASSRTAVACPVSTAVAAATPDPQEVAAAVTCRSAGFLGLLICHRVDLLHVVIAPPGVPWYERLFGPVWSSSGALSR